MKLQIKNYLGSVLYGAEAGTVSELLLLAVKDGADLRGADLSGAYLRGADLSGAIFSEDTILETGEPWKVYLSEVVPALLIAGGRTLAEMLTPNIWECHSWCNCPMAEAFSTHDITGVPILFKPRAEQFIRYFDARLIPMEAVGKI